MLRNTNGFKGAINLQCKFKIETRLSKRQLIRINIKSIKGYIVFIAVIWLIAFFVMILVVITVFSQIKDIFFTPKDPYIRSIEIIGSLMGIVVCVLISIVKRAIGIGRSRKRLLKKEFNKNTKEFFYGQYFFYDEGVYIKNIVNGEEIESKFQYDTIINIKEKDNITILELANKGRVCIDKNQCAEDFDSLMEFLREKTNNLVY